MTQEDKELLLKDLCARLPYGVKLFVPSWDEWKMEYVDRVDILYSVNGDGYIRTVSEDYNFSLEEVKPYLFPLSSMTKEQKKELENLGWNFDNFEIHNVSECIGNYREFISHSDCFVLIDWLNKNHFDYRGLIEKGLALDATGLNIY